ncbi:hypothetical protein V8E52_006290 [Russula decolorans]|jgi:transcription initiation factor TFIIB
MANSAEPSGATCAWTVLGRFGPSICAWTHGLPVSACCLEYPSLYTLEERFFSVNDGLPLVSPPKPRQAAFAPDLSVRLICPYCRDPNPTIIEEFRAGDLVCAGCGWSLEAVLLILRASGGYVLPYSYVLPSRNPVFPKTFAIGEGDDPSRVGGATDPLMEGMEQLDTIIGFKDKDMGISRELQRAATRSQDSRRRKLLSAFRDISS